MNALSPRRILRLFLFGAGFACALALAHAAPPPPTAPSAPALIVRILPQQTIGLLHVAHPGPVLDLLFSPEIAGRIAASPQYRRMATGAGAKGFAALIRHLEERYACDWRALVRRIVGGGLAVAAGPRGEILVVIQAADGTILGEINEMVTASRPAGAGAPQPICNVHVGVPCWSLNGGGAWHAVLGDRLLVSNSLPALQTALVLGTAGGPSLADLASFAQATGASADGPDPLATVAVSRVLLARLPLARTPAPGGSGVKPLGALLVGGYQEALRGAEWIAIDVALEGRTLDLRAALPQAPAQQPAAAPPFPAPVAAPGDGAWANLAVPRRIAALSLVRDLGAFYAAKDQLFPERTSGLIFFENMMGIFFSGRDLTDEVMRALDPHVRIVAAEQVYPPEPGTPVIRLPAVAIVFRMLDPDRFALIAEEAWQKALGLVNFTRGQKAQPGLILDRKTHRGIRYTTAAFSAVDEPDRTRLDSRFNFTPSIARVNEFLILSSTDALAAHVTDAIMTGAPPAAVPGADASLSLDGRRFAAFLETNREGIIRGSMAKKGIDRERATQQFGAGQSLLNSLGKIEIDLRPEPDALRAAARVELNLGQAIPPPPTDPTP